ncbi:uncharacterized protein J8A68_005510 [[Candida] subhashii]|uniref:Ca3427-like PBP 2 domain-containing protein n=1 Tax=[Candida] subhashii TaxID=561895 RepID=A0A8J5QGG9_9ASCO|nr:uncharacterized protein J8A68_005510 [[Candida] subhashii]KAG7660990.1 hypothetical protein J8A68_005510 [[Candida] subhashii]
MTTVLKVAYIPEHFSTPLFFAEQQGYYTSLGLSIEFIKVIEGSGRLINLLNSGEVDIAIGLTEAFVADIAKGNKNIKLVDTYVKSPLLWAISTGAHRDEFHNEGQLEGQTIGVSRIGSGSYIMSFVLGHSLKFDVPFADFPVLSNFKNLRDSVNLKFGPIKQIGEIFTPWSSWVITANADSLAHKKEHIKNFIDAVNSGIDYFNGHISEAVEYISTNLDYSAEDAKEWTTTVEFNSQIGQTPLDWENIVENTSEILRLAGVITDSEDVVKRRLEANILSTNL